MEYPLQEWAEIAPPDIHPVGVFDQRDAPNGSSLPLVCPNMGGGCCWTPASSWAASRHLAPHLGGPWKGWKPIQERERPERPVQREPSPSSFVEFHQAGRCAAVKVVHVHRTPRMARGGC